MTSGPVQEQADAPALSDEDRATERDRQMRRLVERIARSLAAEAGRGDWASFRHEAEEIAERVAGIAERHGIPISDVSWHRPRVTHRLSGYPIEETAP